MANSRSFAIFCKFLFTASCLRVVGRLPAETTHTAFRKNGSTKDKTSQDTRRWRSTARITRKSKDGPEETDSRSSVASKGNLCCWWSLARSLFHWKQPATSSGEEEKESERITARGATWIQTVRVGSELEISGRRYRFAIVGGHFQASTKSISFSGYMQSANFEAGTLTIVKSNFSKCISWTSLFLWLLSQRFCLVLHNNFICLDIFQRWSFR